MQLNVYVLPEIFLQIQFQQRDSYLPFMRKPSAN